MSPEIYRKGVYQKKRNTALLSLVVLLIVLVAGLSALIFLNENQDLRQQAWLGNNDAGDSCVGGNCAAGLADGDLFTSPNNVYRVNLANSGWKIAELPEKNHPFFLGTQFHPEFKARPLSPHPLFTAFIKAILKNKKQ